MSRIHKNKIQGQKSFQTGNFQEEKKSCKNFKEMIKRAAVIKKKILKYKNQLHHKGVSIFSKRFQQTIFNAILTKYLTSSSKTIIAK